MKARRRARSWPRPRCAPPRTGPGSDRVPASDQRRRPLPRSVAARLRPLVRSAVRPCLGPRRGGPKADQTLAALDALDLPTDMRYEVAVLQARAWAWAASGDMGTARKNLEAAAELGKETGDLLGATTALHGLARMGRARQVVDDMDVLAPKVDGILRQPASPTSWQRRKETVAALGRRRPVRGPGRVPVRRRSTRRIGRPSAAGRRGSRRRGHATDRRSAPRSL